MKPILYAPGESAFTSQGLGVLSDAISCVVTEVRNGAFELQMTYPIDGIHFDDIAVTSLIMAKPNAYASPQPFAVYRITKPLNGRVSIYAEHISYWMSHIPVKPCTAPTIVAALSALTSAAVGTNPFTFWTDKSTSASFNIKEPRSLRAALGGQQGSILDVYGGEFEFDRYTVKIHNHRGADRGVTIRYGKNLTDLTQEENIANTITGIMPYWINPQDETDIQYATGTVIYSSNADLYPYRRVLSVDFSADFQSKPTGDQLKAKAQSYITSHNIGVPATSWKVSFAALWQTEEYKDAIGIEQVRLCDTVTVQYEKLGVSAQAKVIKTVYDVLLERYTSIEIGDARSDFASTLKKVQEQTAAEADAASATAIERAVNHATQMITGGLGGHVVEVLDADGKPQELVILGDTDDIATAQDVWRWNHNGLGHSSTGYTGQFTTAITADGHIVADFIDTGNLNASLITTGVLNAALITAGYLSATRIKGGTLTLGGDNNVNGVLQILNSSGVEVGRWNNSGINLTQGSFNLGNGNFAVTNAGALSAKSGHIAGMKITDEYMCNDSIGNLQYTAYYGEGDAYIGKGGMSCSRVYSQGGFGHTADVRMSSDRISFRIDNAEQAAIGMDTTNYSGLYIANTIARLNDNDCSIKIIKNSSQEVDMPGPVVIGGSLTVSGTKSRSVGTDQYADRLLYCYETASPTFGDIGEGKIGEDGLCYIPIDPVFAQTVSLRQYQVFLQRYGSGECYVADRKPGYFIVAGTAGLSFGWELKAKQSGYDQLRLERDDKLTGIENETDYATEAINHIIEIQQERIPA